MERDTFVFYPSFLDGIEKLPDEEQLKAYRMIARYGVYGEEPEETQSIALVVYCMAVPSIDSAKKNRRNGAKGGRPPKTNKETDGYGNEKPVVIENENQWLNNEKPLAETYEDVYVYEDESVAVDNNIISFLSTNNEQEQKKREKPIQHKYGAYDNVRLSDSDIEKLQQEFPIDWHERIERLSEYMASTGKSYKNHLATIRSWAKKEYAKKQPLLATNQITKTYVMTEDEKKKDTEAQHFLENYLNGRGKNG